MTFHELIRGFLLYRKAKPTAKEYEQLAKQIYLQWPNEWPTFSQLEHVHQTMAHIPHRANKALSLIKSAFYWGIRRGLYSGHNPAVGIKRHKTFSRERVLTLDEIHLILSQLDLMMEKFAAILVLMLTTGARLCEARTMRWADVDLVSGRWIQRRTKNGKVHVTYVPLQTRLWIAKLPRDTEFVFRGHYERCWCSSGVHKMWRLIRTELNLPADVHLHDLRRTLATHLYRSTRDEYLIKRAINHLDSGVTAVYVRIPYEEVAQALQAQADRFFRLEETTTIHPTPERRQTCAHPTLLAN